MSWMQSMRDGATATRPRTSSYEVNWWRFFVSQFFWLTETAYFGWNALPGSEAELICDGIVCVLVALSIKRTSAGKAAE
jgi:hypothetical protein